MSTQLGGQGKLIMAEESGPGTTPTPDTEMAHVNGIGQVDETTAPQPAPFLTVFPDFHDQSISAMAHFDGVGDDDLYTLLTLFAASMQPTHGNHTHSDQLDLQAQQDVAVYAPLSSEETANHGTPSVTLPSVPPHNHSLDSMSGEPTYLNPMPSSSMAVPHLHVGWVECVEEATEGEVGPFHPQFGLSASGMLYYHDQSNSNNNHFNGIGDDELHPLVSPTFAPSTQPNYTNYDGSDQLDPTLQLHGVAVHPQETTMQDMPPTAHHLHEHSVDSMSGEPPFSNPTSSTSTAALDSLEWCCGWFLEQSQRSCGESFPNRLALLHHMGIAHGVRGNDSHPITCQWVVNASLSTCGETCRRASFARHVDIHLARRIPCSFCEKTYSRQDTLVLHIRRQHTYYASQS